MRNPIPAKVDFCNTSLAKNLVFQFQTPRFRPRNHQKKQRGKKNDKCTFVDQKYPKSFENGSAKSAKINKIQAWNSKCPFLNSPPRNVPGSSQDAKIEAPIMPNDTHGHHKSKICVQKRQESSIQKPAHISAEEFDKTKPNNKNQANQ